MIAMRPETHPVAIVLSSGMNGLGAVRALSERGVRVVVIGESDKDIALKSRWPVDRLAMTKHRTPAGIEELRALLNSISAERVVVIPTSDWFVSALGSLRSDLPEKFSVVAPESDLARMLIDKAEEVKRIESLVPVPATVTPLPPSAEELLASLRLPIIVKPRSFEHMCIGGKNVVLRSAEEVRDFYARFPGVLDRVVAQEVIEGPDENLWVCNATFGRESEIIRAFTFRRLRLSPPHYGVTSYAVSERNPEVLDMVAKIGRALRYVGPAMVEFKWDPRDRVYRYIELNPRLGLANYFDTRCGMSNAFASYCVFAGVRISVEGVQKDGVIFASVFEDVYARRQDGESFASILWFYMRRASRPHVFAYWSWRDPLPWLEMTRRHGRSLIKAVVRRIHGVTR